MRRALIAVLLLLLTPASTRAAETAYLLDSAGPAVRIVALDGTGTQFGDPLPITGLGSNDTVAAIDTLGGTLHALTVNTATNPDHAELYRLEVGPGAVTAAIVGRPSFIPSGSLGAAFDDGTGLLRVVSSAGQNLYLDPATAAIVDADAAPAFAADDPNEGQAPVLSGLAHLGGALFAVAGADKSLARLGENGVVSTVGPTGVAAGVGQDSLDASVSGGTLWWLRTGYFRADLWQLDPATGRALRGIPFDVAANGLALLPSAEVFLGSDRAGYYTEGEEAALTVWRSTVLTGETRVPYQVREGSAGVAATSGTVTFADGETRGTIRVPIPQDTAAEGTQFFSVGIGEPAGNREAGAIGGNQELHLTVVDDDGAAGPSATPPGPPAAPDRARPTLRLSGVPRRALTRAQLLRGFRVRALPSELVSLRVSLRANPRRGAFASAYELVLFTKRFGRSPFTRSVRVRPARRLVGRITRRTKLRLVVEATDAAGNRRAVSRTVHVRR